jgi:fatty-acyl-CoA synthase
MRYSDSLQAGITLARSHGIGDLLRRSAARHPDKLALVCGETRETFAELDRAVNRVANALAARGIARGERVALLSRNCRGFVLAYLALARLGAISVPVNFMLKAAEVAYILGHAGAIGMVVEEPLLGVAEEAIAAAGCSLRLRGVIGAGHAGWEPLEAWTRHADDSAPALPAADDEPAQILYTSGTESRPKGATLSARSLMAQYESCIVDGEMSADDVELHCLPLYHCAQLHCFLSPDLLLGATSVIMPGADAGAMLAAVERERISKLFCPPTVWIALLRHPDFERRDLSSLRRGYYGASVMPMEVVRELSRRLPQVRLFNFYGQTELAPLATVLKPEDQLSRIGSAGRPALNVETRVVDDEDRPVPPGTVGEIVHRGPHIMLGYWNDEAKTAEAFRNGWFHSGDLGVFDAEGYLRVVDRKKDMIKTGGENVASREVEEVIYTHPAVAEAAVFGLPHERWIECVTAAVVCRAGQAASEDELLAFCREHLAGYKAPKRIILLDALPKNASGKILKRELRERFLQQ